MTHFGTTPLYVVCMQNVALGSFFLFALWGFHQMSFYECFILIN